MTDRLNTPLQGLAAIYLQVNAEIPSESKIKLSMEGNDLELSLDTDDGLKSHEQFTVTARERDYRCVYFGMQDEAAKTFLYLGYQQEIDAIELIKRYKGMVIEQTKQTDSELINYKTDKKYSKLWKNRSLYRNTR